MNRNHKEVKQKECHDCDCDVLFTPFRSTDKFCSWDCAKKNQKPVKSKQMKPIPKMSPKRKKEIPIYLKQRMDFLNKPENKICFIEGCGRSATTIEHTAGRIGKKYLDEKFWKPCCFGHNSELENNTELSNEYQFSKFHEGKKIKK